MEVAKIVLENRSDLPSHKAVIEDECDAINIGSWTVDALRRALDGKQP